jgi:predicted amino acid-binding ACT domain protein
MAEENGNATPIQPTTADQVSLMILTNAISQQQLNTDAARSQMINASNALTLGVQMQQLAILQKITGVSVSTTQTTTAQE